MPEADVLFNYRQIMSLIIKALGYTHPDNEVLFRDLNFTLGLGDKAALVGINGAGKSTLLEVIAGRLSASSGEVNSSEVPWFVPQHLGEYDGCTIAQVLEVEKKLNALSNILNGDADPQHFTDLNDDWEIEEKVKRSLEKWGLSDLSLEDKLGRLSGGQKTKVFLAGMEIHEPEVILLDEPSNHLDSKARKKLYSLILQSKASILVISHDKTLLNLMNKTLELSKFGIETFGGNFDFYQQQKQEKVGALHAQLNEQAKALKQSEKKAQDMAYQRQRQEAKGRSAGQSHSMPRIIAGGLKSKAERSTAKVLDAQQEKITTLSETMRETRAQIQLYQPLKINLKSSDLHPGKILMEATGINYSYGPAPLWTPISFQIKSGDRIHIEGENGSGKTTLLKIMTKQLEVTSGEYFRADFSYLYLDQDYTMINANLSIYDQVQEYNTNGLQEHEIKAMLIYAQFDKESFDRKCDGLSGGEKMKLSLCCLSVSNEAPDVLILDEPTNNLDVKSLEVLTLAVKNFEGTLLVISHDEYFTKEIGLRGSIVLS